MSVEVDEHSHKFTERVAPRPLPFDVSRLSALAEAEMKLRARETGGEAGTADDVQLGNLRVD